MQPFTPRLEISLDKITSNAAAISELCGRHGIQLIGITKGCGGLPEVARAMLKGGASAIGDSRLLNLQRLSADHVAAPLHLIRTPSLSQTEQVVGLATLSHNTELAVIEKLAQEARNRGQTHQIVLMVELGDGREGIWPADIVEIAEKVIGLEGIDLVGISGNLGCFTLSYPTADQVALLLDAHRRVENALDVSLDVASVGGSAVLSLLLQNDCPPGITHLRAGEAILLGTDAIEGHRIPDTHNDAFQLVAEVIEVRRSTERDADGGRQVIVAVGYQDAETSGLTVQMLGAEIQASTSDHLILSAKDEVESIAVGQEIRFLPDYRALVQLCTSPYVAQSVSS
jgi:predicted amino acid racemase